VAIIAFIQQKGGVGKSTMAAHVTGELAQKHSVVVFDLDPQRSMAEWAQAGQGVLRDLVRAIDIDHLKPAAFKKLVDAAQEQVDYVILDCPPALPDAGQLAALLADVAVVPVQPSPVDIRAAKPAYDLLIEAQKARGGKGKPTIAFVPSRVIQGTVYGRDLPGELKAMFPGVAVLPSIGQRIAIAESATTGQTIQEYLPESTAAGEFRELTRAIQKLVK
jgi:chromosome partitioning protein